MICAPRKFGLPQAAMAVHVTHAVCRPIATSMSAFMAFR